jgi:membrane associated rhomboid family serine protease
MGRTPSSSVTTMTTTRALLRAPLGFPWATASFVAGCVITTLPMLVSTRYHLILGVGNEVADNPHVRWWHAIVTPFVHGGGFPGTAAHLAINVSLFVVLGSLLERTLGTGRFFALCAACLGAGTSVQLARGQYAHGISGVAWAFVAFAPLVIAHALRSEGSRTLRDPALLLVALLLAVGVLGLVVKWHLLAVLVAAPFVLAWRGVLRRNLESVDRGQPVSVWGPRARAVGIAVPALLAAFSAAMTLGAVLGYVR